MKKYFFFLLLFSCSSKLPTAPLSQTTNTSLKKDIQNTMLNTQKSASRVTTIGKSVQKVIKCCEVSSGGIGTVSDVENQVVHVFTKENDQWKQSGTLRAHSDFGGEGFGWSVDIENDVIVVGAPEEFGFSEYNKNGAGAGNPDWGFRKDAGAVYIFRLKDGQWKQEARLRESNGRFGNNIILKKGRVFVSAPNQGYCGHGETPCNLGGVYVYHFRHGKWEEEASLPKVPIRYSEFGHRMQVLDNRLLVQGTATKATDNALPIFIYERKGRKWSLSRVKTDPPFVFLPNAELNGDFLAVTIGKFVEEMDQAEFQKKGWASSHVNLRLRGTSIYRLGKKGWERIGLIPGPNDLYDEGLQSLSIKKDKLFITNLAGKKKSYLLSSFVKKYELQGKESAPE